MHMAGIVLQQAFIMLILILIGAMCFKLKLLSEETVTQMSGLVLKAVNPVVIFLAYQRELEASLVHNLISIHHLQSNWTVAFFFLLHLPTP